MKIKHENPAKYSSHAGLTICLPVRKTVIYIVMIIIRGIVSSQQSNPNTESRFCHLTEVHAVILAGEDFMCCPS